MLRYNFNKDFLYKGGFMQSSFSLLYAEDDQRTRDGYLLYFSKFFQNVYPAKNGKEAWEVYKQERPSVVILDINMPEISGLDVAHMIREIDSNCKIIMLTAYSDLEKLLAAIKLNLTEYLIKPAKKLDLEKVLIDTINELNENTKNIIKLKYGYIWDINAKKLYKRNKEINLTKKEISLFNLLSSNLNVSFSNEEIMNYLYDFSPTDESFDTSKYRTLLYRLKTKLGYDIIESIYGIGYKLKLAK